MPGRNEIERAGRVLFVSGLSIFALSGSFSITLTEGGLLLAWVGFLLKSRWSVRGREIVFLDYAVLALLVWELISALASPHRTMSLKAYRSDWLILTYFLVSYGMESLSQLGRLLKLLATVASVLAVYGIVQHFTGIDYIKHKSLDIWNETYKAMGLLGHHITFGVFYAWVFSISLSFLVFVSGKLRSRITWTVLTCLAALAVLYSYSRAAWLGATFSLLALVVVRRFRVGYLVLIVVAIVVTAVAVEPSAVDRATISVGSDPASRGDVTRIHLLRTSLRMIAAHPLSGIGPGTFMAEFDNFKVPGEYSTTCHPHNDLVNSAVRSGFIGLAILVTVLAAALKGALVVYRRSTDSITQRLALALGCGLIAILVSGVFQCNFTDSEIAVQAWLIIGSLGLLMRTRPGDHRSTG